MEQLFNEQTTGLILKAVHFSAGKHRDQRRKDLAQTPYINHPLEVAHILWFEGGVRDLDILIAGMLHDTVEDTDTSFQELEEIFGNRVRSIVGEVTDDTTMHSQQRKMKQVQKAPFISKEAQQVKLADKISNLRDIFSEPPRGWSLDRQTEYYQWALKVVDGIRGVNPLLEQCFDQIYQRFFRERNPNYQHPTKTWNPFPELQD